MTILRISKGRVLEILFAFFWITSVQAQLPLPWQTHFQPAATPVMRQIVSLHDFIMVIMIGIVLVVFTLLMIIVWRFRASKNPIPSKVSHNTPLEVIWTIIPVIIVIIIAIPSLRLQFYMARIHEPELTIKVVGHQWYWSYEYPHHNVEFDSRIIPSQDIEKDQIRLLSVDRPLVVPVNTNIRVLTTSDDVIHSWTVPAFGIKKDTIPGRLNETWMRITKEGTFYGQCSELCGPQHAFMPIEVKVVSKAHFAQWLEKNKSGERSVIPTDKQAIKNKKSEKKSHDA